MYNYMYDRVRRHLPAEEKRAHLDTLIRDLVKTYPVADLAGSLAVAWSVEDIAPVLGVTETEVHEMLKQPG